VTSIVSIDDAYDRDYASDGISRFGAYVRQRAHLFVDDWEPLSPVTFAATVWAIASGPLMSPGYVRTRSSVGGVHCRHADEPGLLLAEVDMCLPWSADLRNRSELAGWSSWTSTLAPELTDPDERRPALLLRACVRVPVHEGLLPNPSRFAALDVTVAKQAVAVICEQVNTRAAPVVALLRSEALIGVGR
jgi:hypothetical protein